VHAKIIAQRLPLRTPAVAVASAAYYEAGRNIVKNNVETGVRRRWRVVLLVLFIPILVVGAVSIDEAASHFHAASAARIFGELERAKPNEIASSRIGRRDAVLVVGPDGSVIVKLPPPRLAWITYLDQQVVDYETYTIEIERDASSGARVVTLHHGSD